MTRVTNYAEAIEQIAQGAVIAQDISAQYREEGPLTNEEALDHAANHALSNAYEAHHHIGGYRFGITAERQQEIQFIAAVATDIMHGAVERPSVGNVRQAALAQLKSKELAA